MKRFLFLLILLISFFTINFAFSKENATILSVTDGDTLKIEYKGVQEKVRLIGIDTPESTINKKAKRDSLRSQEDVKTIISQGQKAKEFAQSLVHKGDKTHLEFDITPRDKYGRLLAYVYLPSGKMLNEEIVKAGYANLMTIPPNVKYQKRLLSAYQDAIKNKRGLWSKSNKPTQTQTNQVQTVIFNTKTMIYHKPDCKLAKKCTRNCIKINKPDAIKRGGHACYACGG